LLTRTLLVSQRVQVALILLAVLCVPALTRVTQHLTSVTTSHETSGFSKSADAAPERVTLSPELCTVANAIAAAAVVEAVQPAWARHRVEVWLSAQVPIATPCPLRAPPAVARL
jgi:hypothetical protein